MWEFQDFPDYPRHYTDLRAEYADHILGHLVPAGESYVLRAHAQVHVDHWQAAVAMTITSRPRFSWVRRPVSSVWMMVPSMVPKPGRRRRRVYMRKGLIMSVPMRTSCGKRLGKRPIPGRRGKGIPRACVLRRTRRSVITRGSIIARWSVIMFAIRGWVTIGRRRIPGSRKGIVYPHALRGRRCFKGKSRRMLSGVRPRVRGPWMVESRLWNTLGVVVSWPWYPTPSGRTIFGSLDLYGDRLCT